MQNSSILVKIRNPINRSLSRTSYYVNIGFVIDETDVEIPMKIDTGAAYTVVGMGIKPIKKFKEKIMTDGRTGKLAYDATETELNLYAYEVEDFHLTEDIVLPKLQICFSEKLGEKAIIGMDILSLFNFSYTLDANSTNGTFTIHNYPNTLSKLLNSNFYKDSGYIMPDMVLSIDNPKETEKQNNKFSKTISAVIDE